ncbi:MAG: endonuclease [Leptospiraceae bacterium]|nr:endonuclease [Leptospiraceae bacterium]MDW7975396.1 endonuclease [Leptospiraceae bacterium]
MLFLNPKKVKIVFLFAILWALYPIYPDTDEILFFQRFVLEKYDLKQNYGKGCELKDPNEQNFREMKKKLRILYINHYPYSFYCQCKIFWDPLSNKLYPDPSSCGYRKKSPKAKVFINWEHVMPASRIGGKLPCWKERLCFDKDKGKPFRGRKCCNEIDPCFNIMEGDVHNLVPEIFELNNDRKNFRFGLIHGEKREYGECDFEVDTIYDVAEPMESIRGDIARAYLYMSWFYGIPLTNEEKKLFSEWNLLDPPSETEIKLNKLKARIQGNENPFISYYKKP